MGKAFYPNRANLPKAMPYRFLRPVLLLLLLLVCLPPSHAADTITEQVDRYIQGQMKKNKIPGLSLAVVKDGKALLVKGYGLANVEHNVPVKPETIFQSGSVGKQFTATAIMTLVEEGKLKLDDKINTYFSDAPQRWEKITVRHLLTHTSGMTDYPNDFDFRRDYTEDELLKKAQAIALAFQPGEKWSYSNIGYLTLGVLIHKVSGKFYGDVLQERIFKPLGMDTAQIINESAIIPNRSEGYKLVKDVLKHQDWVAPSLNTTADGSLYLTLNDMMKWDAALYTEKLLKSSSLEQMWTPVTLNNGKTYDYGFGWGIGANKLVEHGGSWQGFKSFIARYRAEKLTIILFANLAQTNPDELAHGVAKFYLRNAIGTSR
jgi:CubicO group peptidase (beta-lactamase class C family)